MPKISQEEVETQDRVAEFYEDKRYGTWYSRKYQKDWSKKMIRMLPKNINVKRILDNGCGTGNFVECLKSINREKTIGSDISNGMLIRAKKRIGPVVQSDSQQLPFKSNSFNIVFARSLFHHLPEPDLGAKETARVLKKGGYTVIVDTVETLMSTLPRHLTEDSEHFSEEHKNFSAKEYLIMINKHLKVEKVHYFGYFAYPLLGFPDIMNAFRFVPLKKLVVPMLNALDAILEKTPLLNKHLAWGIMVLAKKL